VVTIADATARYLVNRPATSLVSAMATVHGYNVASIVVVAILLGSAVLCGLTVTSHSYAESGAVTTPESPKRRTPAVSIVAAQAATSMEAER
jgi:hypothetical protein